MLGKRFVHHYGKSLKTFSILGVNFFCKKVKLLNFGRVTFKSSLSKGLNVLAIFRYLVKVEVFSEGKVRKKILLLPGLLSKD